MKRFLSLFLLLFGFTSFAQDKTLPVDESGKYTFLEITALKQVPENILSANAKQFFKASSKYIKLLTTAGDTAFSGQGKMLIQKGVAGIGHPSASADYHISIALRDGKYKLILTDFVITPYERDRYGNFVPQTVSSALEKPPGKLNRGEWEANMAFIAGASRKIADKLKVMMSNTAAKTNIREKKEATVSTTAW